MNTLRDFFINTIGISSQNQHKILVTIAVVFTLWFIRFIVLRIVWRQTKEVRIRYRWKRAMSIAIPIIGLIMVLPIWLPHLGQFGAFLGLMAAGFAIALKDPLTNLAGWLFIIFRKPFLVGDRIQIGSYAGDVIDIRLFQFTILEIGNWVEADQSTGRIIHLPNGKVFMDAQANYSTGFEYIWHEIPILITFESNWVKAKSILQEIIKIHAEHLSSTAGKEILDASKNYLIYYKHLTPIVYVKVKDYGVQLTLRYLCNPRKRRGSENEIWENILDKFGVQSDIQFAYPTTRFYKSGENTDDSLGKK